MSWRVGSLSAAMRALAVPADAVLLDLGLPDSMASRRSIAPATGTSPLIVLTAKDDDAIAVLAVQRGAQDYLVKSRTDAELLSGRYAMRASARNGAATSSDGKRSCGRRTRWRPSAGWPAASRTISTTC